MAPNVSINRFYLEKALVFHSKLPYQAQSFSELWFDQSVAPAPNIGADAGDSTSTLGVHTDNPANTEPVGSQREADPVDVKYN